MLQDFVHERPVGASVLRQGVWLGRQRPRIILINKDRRFVLKGTDKWQQLELGRLCRR
jgi:hypothetical protein